MVVIKFDVNRQNDHPHHTYQYDQHHHHLPDHNVQMNPIC